jgi:hypothetical protein
MKLTARILEGSRIFIESCCKSNRKNSDCSRKYVAAVENWDGNNASDIWIAVDDLTCLKVFFWRSTQTICKTSDTDNFTCKNARVVAEPTFWPVSPRVPYRPINSLDIVVLNAQAIFLSLCIHTYHTPRSKSEIW